MIFSRFIPLLLMIRTHHYFISIKAKNQNQVDLQNIISKRYLPARNLKLESSIFLKECCYHGNSLEIISNFLRLFWDVKKLIRVWKEENNSIIIYIPGPRLKIRWNYRQLRRVVPCGGTFCLFASNHAIGGHVATTSWAAYFRLISWQHHYTFQIAITVIYL